MKMPGFVAELSLFQTIENYSQGVNSVSPSSTKVIAQSWWCEPLCQATFIACGAACTGPWAPVCAAGCFAAFVKCVEKCEGDGPPPCINPTSCTSASQCCANHFCMNNKCVNCGKTPATRCSGPSGTPCCSGYHCCGIGCYP